MRQWFPVSTIWNAFRGWWGLYQLAALLLLIILFSPGIQAEPIGQDLLPPEQLLQLIQQGGHILYMRHGPTDHEQKDRNRNDFSVCEQQRSLSRLGRKTMANIGKWMQEKVPIASVSSSPYCRCIDTAQLVFGRYQVDQQLQFSISKNKQEASELGAYLLRQMLQVSTSEGNAIFVGHTANLKDAVGVWPKPEGVVAVFSRENGVLTYRGKINPENFPK